MGLSIQELSKILGEFIVEAKVSRCEICYMAHFFCEACHCPNCLTTEEHEKYDLIRCQVCGAHHLIPKEIPYIPICDSCDASIESVVEDDEAAEDFDDDWLDDDLEDGPLDFECDEGGCPYD